ncbi:hypothetical protein [Streptosporangium sp. KLBMP 9127]|nr:hypothetical protein [Streptosporangium sp. KLBMP 9127]
MSVELSWQCPVDVSRPADSRQQNYLILARVETIFMVSGLEELDSAALNEPEVT